MLISFAGGRVEEFIENARTWGVVDLRDPARGAAAMRAMAMLHAAPLPAERFPAGTPALPKNLRMWAATAEKAAKQLIAGGGRKGLLAAAIDIPSLVSVEVEWMLQFLQQLDSPIVFCHNDLQEGNLMEVAGGLGGAGEGGAGSVGKVAGPLGEVKVVDYEYGGYNYRGFDWGNFFCEIACDNFVEQYPGFCLNPDKYPSDEQQKVLLQAYLRGREPAAGEMDAMIVEANSFAMASHLFWTLWAVAQAADTTIKWGYLEYAQQRALQYFVFKERAIKATGTDPACLAETFT